VINRVSKELTVIIVSDWFLRWIW